MRTAVSLALLTLALGSTALAADTYGVDNGHSSVMFRIKHKGVSYTYGRFNQISGSWTMNAADASKSKIEITIAANSIDTNSPKRDGHLRSPDFFNVKQFPKITFKSTKVQMLAPRKSGELVFQVTGDLTLCGVTKQVTFKALQVGEADDPRAGKISGYEAVFTIKRSDYGMKYGLGGIGDEVKLFVSVEGVKK